jgi:hypothetical protein
MPNPFTQPGDFLRGNLHTHTTRSDGQLSPQDTVDAYAARGYDFLALTDHGVITDPAPLDAHGMTLIPGVETGVAGSPFGSSFHVVALGMDRVPTVPADVAPELAMRELAAQVPLCFACHPFWSLIEGSHLLPLEGYVGVEVYNQTCQGHIGRGPSEAAWDTLLAHGRPVWGLAVDDAHNPGDIGHAWIMVKSASRAPEAILEAVRQGHFYATVGPELRGLRRHGENLAIACSPCVNAIVLGASPGSGRASYYMPSLERPFEEILLPLPTSDAWLRVEVIDAEGKKAWSNAFRPDEL